MGKGRETGVRFPAPSRKNGTCFAMGLQTALRSNWEIGRISHHKGRGNRGCPQPTRPPGAGRGAAGMQAGIDSWELENKIQFLWHITGTIILFVDVAATAPVRWKIALFLI